VPKFGTDSSASVQKLMSLTDRVRPHDSKKHPLPAAINLNTRPLSVPSSPAVARHSSPGRSQRHLVVPAVQLSAESSSVGGELMASNHRREDTTISKPVVDGRLFVGHRLEVQTGPSLSRQPFGSRHSYTDGGTTRPPAVPLAGRLSAPVSPCHRPLPLPDYETAVQLRHCWPQPTIHHSRVHSLDSASDSGVHDSDIDHLPVLSDDDCDDGNAVSLV
jgi:hypothetical protein